MIFVRKGKKTFVTDNVKETEIILNCGTKYIFLQYNVNKNSKNIITLDVLMLTLKDE